MEMLARRKINPNHFLGENALEPVIFLTNVALEFELIRCYYEVFFYIDSINKHVVGG